MAKCTLNRRTFLKVSVAAGAAAALDADELFVPAAEAAEGAAEETKIVKTCPEFRNSGRRKAAQSQAGQGMRGF